MKRFAAPLIAVNKTDEQSRISHERMKLIEDLEILRNKTRFEDEVLRRVSGNGQFWRQDQLRASGRETLVSADDPLKIAAQISNCWVNLSKTNPHPALQQTMRHPASSNPLFLAFNGLSSHQPKTAFEKARSRSRQWLRDSERSSGVLRDNFFTRTLARLWRQLCVILFCCCFRPNPKLYTRVRTVLGWTQ